MPDHPYFPDLPKTMKPSQLSVGISKPRLKGVRHMNLERGGGVDNWMCTIQWVDGTISD